MPSYAEEMAHNPAFNAQRGQAGVALDALKVEHGHLQRVVKAQQQKIEHLERQVNGSKRRKA